MTFTLACGDVMPGCTATFTNDDRDALMRDVAAHAAADHGIREITPELAVAVGGHVHEVR